MKAKKKSSIFIKTQKYLVTFCIMLLLLVWFFEVLFISLHYSRFQINTVNNIADFVSNSDNIKKSEEIENIAYDNNVCIVILNDYGEVQEYNTKMPGCNVTSEQSLEVIYGFLNSKKNKVVKTLKFSDNNRAFIYGIKNNNVDVFIYSPLEDHNLASSLMKNQLIYVIIIGILVSSAASIYISNLITRPIRNIAKNAINIGKENYEEDFEQTGIKEIDDLQDNLNIAQKELSKVQTYQKDLLANVSHDLKTPLTMIKAYAEKIRDISYKDKDKLDSDTTIIMDEVDRLSLLVDDILSLSKMQRDEDVLNYSNYDLVKEIKTIIKKYDIIKEAEKYTFITSLPDKLIINADKGKINQVIYNLINNAINYTGDDKCIYISLKKDNKGYIFSVRDTGKGIKNSELKNIWHKYYKNDKNHRRNVVSTGIGLSIVKEVLEKHGFVYGVTSKINEGSTFYFRLPKDNKK